MAYYRMYQLHGPKNEVESFYEFEADDDPGAMALAERRRGLNAVELWSGHRKVHRWEAMDDTARHGFDGTGVTPQSSSS